MSKQHLEGKVKGELKDKWCHWRETILWSDVKLGNSGSIANEGPKTSLNLELPPRAASHEARRLYHTAFPFSYIHGIPCLLGYNVFLYSTTPSSFKKKKIWTTLCLLEWKEPKQSHPWRWVKFNINTYNQTWCVSRSHNTVSLRLFAFMNIYADYEFRGT